MKVTKIEATSQEWGTTADLLHKVAKGTATGQLENSEKFRLSVATPLAADSLSVDIDVMLAHQNIADLNAYFEISDGFTLSGTLENGRNHYPFHSSWNKGRGP